MASSALSELDRATSELLSSRRNDVDFRLTKMLQLVNSLKVCDAQSVFLGLDVIKVVRACLCEQDERVRATAVRCLKYMCCNQLIVDNVKRLNLPHFIMMCLEREDESGKAERLAALKWLRYMLDHYPLSMPECCVRSLMAVAQHSKHEYARICLDLLRELCILNPMVMHRCNGFKVLIELISNPLYGDAADQLLLTVLYILDHPNTRKYLRPSTDVQQLLSPLVGVDPYKKNAQSTAQIEQNKAPRELAQRVLQTMLKSVTGVFYLGSSDVRKRTSYLRLMVDLMKLPNKIAGIQWARKCIFDVLEKALLPLSDTTKIETLRGPNLIVNYVCLILMAFMKNGLIECLVDVGMRSDLELAPRARTLLQRIQFLSAKYLPPKLCSEITAIERVMNDAAMFNADSIEIQQQFIGNGGGRRGRRRPPPAQQQALEITVQRNFANMMISELTEQGLLDIENDDNENELKHNNVRTDNNDAKGDDDQKHGDGHESGSGGVRISSVDVCHRLGPELDLNSTFIRYRYMLERDIPQSMMLQDRRPYHSHRSMDDFGNEDGRNLFAQFSFRSQKQTILETLKFDQNAALSESQIVELLRSTQVTQSKNFEEWNMELVWKVLNGPLWNTANLQVALHKTKFLRRLVQYLRPSKQNFSILAWTPSKMRHAQVACQLFRLMTSDEEALKDKEFVALVEEVFDCLKDQIESNLKKRRPSKQFAPFSRASIKYTLSRTYVILIGILSESQLGMSLFKKFNMFPFLFPLTTRELSEHRMKADRVVGPNDYLLRFLATNLDYTFGGEFPLLFSQWIAKGSFYLRKSLITHLELLYRAQMPKFDEWSITVLTVLLKSEQRLALTALKVLEKINLAQNGVKSHQYLIDLIKTQPTDALIGGYGQFLFIKMLSTVEGLKFLQQSDWLNRKRRDWIDAMHTRYTHMMESALVQAVSRDQYAPNTSSTRDNNNNSNNNNRAEQKAEEKEERHDGDDNWLPYHLIYENRSDEEELYAEYLTHSAWSLSIVVTYSSGKEVKLETDCFFDWNAFCYKHDAHSPVSLGPGVHAILLDPNGVFKPLQLEPQCKLTVILDIGQGCLGELYNEQSLVKTCSVHDIERFPHCGIVRRDQLYCFFDEQPQAHGRGFCRVFWSLQEIQTSHNNALVRPLPHFYGELAKTEEGCTYILGHEEFNMDLQSFVLTVHSAYLEMLDMTTIDTNDGNDENFRLDSRGGLVDNNSNLECRSSLWALGMIGSSPKGLELLRAACTMAADINILDEIAVLAKQSPILSIRGTCLYVLGLLSRTQSGMTHLSHFGFGFPADNFDLDLAVAMPEDVHEFFELRDNRHMHALHTVNHAISCFSPPALCRPGNMKPMDPNELLGKSGHTEETVLAHISSLCNNVTQKSSASALHRLRSKKPSIFTNPLLFRETLKLLNTYQFKLAAKRFILFTLFDQVILDEDSGALQLFDASLSAPILSFKQIREWRYNYRQKVIQSHKNKPPHHRKGSSMSRDKQKQAAPKMHPSASSSSAVSSSSSAQEFNLPKRSQQQKQDAMRMKPMNANVYATGPALHEDQVVVKHHRKKKSNKSNGPPPVPAAVKERYTYKVQQKQPPVNVTVQPKHEDANNNNNNNANMTGTRPQGMSMHQMGQMQMQQLQRLQQMQQMQHMQMQQQMHMQQMPAPPNMGMQQNVQPNRQVYGGMKMNQYGPSGPHKQLPPTQVQVQVQPPAGPAQHQRMQSPYSGQNNANNQYYTGNKVEMAGSPMSQIAGPNPLQALNSDNSANYESSQ